jgi:hypothetical protein
MKNLFADVDKEIERLLAMTDEEVIAEAKANGIDIDTEVKKCKSILEIAIADVEFNKVFPR